MSSSEMNSLLYYSHHFFRDPKIRLLADEVVDHYVDYYDDDDVVHGLEYSDDNEKR